MIKHQLAVPNYVHFIKLEDLPEKLQKIVYSVAIRTEYDMYDYSDGDFYFGVNLRGIPYSIAGGDEEMREQWTRLMDWLRGELDEEVVTTNKFAIYCSQ